MESEFTIVLSKIKQSGLYRCLPESMDFSRYDFHSNDYLGLAEHPRLKTAAVDAITTMGIGSTGSRLLSGNYNVIETLETELAKFLGSPAVLVFNSGYQLNVGVIPTLYGKGDLVIADKLCHASLLDGIQASKADLKRFRHNDTEHLKRLLTQHRTSYQRCLLVTESLFSMDGDVAPLEALEQLAQDFDVELMVDEAHAIGVLGPSGRGLCAELGIIPTYLVGTFGKAFGTFGSFVATSALVRDFLINKCRSFIYTTALPIPVTAATLASLRMMADLDDSREHLRTISRSLYRSLKDKGHSVLGDHHIVSVLWPGNEALLEKHRELKARKFAVSSIRYPTVPKHGERFRFSLKSSLTLKDINDVVAQF